MKEKDDKIIENEEVVVEELDNEPEQTQEDEGSNSAKLPPNVEEIKERWWLKYLITAGVLAVMVVLTAWMQGAFAKVTEQILEQYGVTEVQYRFQQWSNAFAVPGILAVCFGLLIVASNGGTFDMLAYGVTSLFRLFKRDPLDRKYGNFYEYRKAKQEKKRDFWYMVIVGGVYTLIGAALLGGYFAA